jgi:hypothetical protein
MLVGCVAGVVAAVRLNIWGWIYWLIIPTTTAYRSFTGLRAEFDSKTRGYSTGLRFWSTFSIHPTGLGLTTNDLIVIIP